MVSQTPPAPPSRLRQKNKLAKSLLLTEIDQLRPSESRPASRLDAYTPAIWKFREKALKCSEILTLDRSAFDATNYKDQANPSFKYVESVYIDEYYRNG